MVVFHLYTTRGHDLWISKFTDEATQTLSRSFCKAETLPSFAGGGKIKNTPGRLNHLKSYLRAAEPGSHGRVFRGCSGPSAAVVDARTVQAHGRHWELLWALLWWTLGDTPGPLAADTGSHSGLSGSNHGSNSRLRSGVRCCC